MYKKFLKRDIHSFYIKNEYDNTYLLKSYNDKLFFAKPDSMNRPIKFVLESIYNDYTVPEGVYFSLRLYETKSEYLSFENDLLCIKDTPCNKLFVKYHKDNKKLSTEPIQYNRKYFILVKDKGIKKLNIWIYLFNQFDTNAYLDDFDNKNCKEKNSLIKNTFLFSFE